MSNKFVSDGKLSQYFNIPSPVGCKDNNEL